MNSEAMDDVAGAIGVDLAMVLAARRGGRTLHVPSVVQHDKILHLIIGREAAETLIGELGGMDIQLPTLKSLEQHRRKELVCRLAARGLPRSDIAEAAQMSERHVGRILTDEAPLVDAYRRTAPPLETEAL